MRGMRGPADNQQSRRLSQGELARVLSRFGIRPKVMWPLRRTPEAKSYRGYLRVQFERSQASYCREDVSPSQRRKNNILGV
jgi:hypothetical protein